MDTEVYKLGDELDSFNSQEVQDGLKAILDKGCKTRNQHPALRVFLQETERWNGQKGRNWRIWGNDAGSINQRWTCHHLYGLKKQRMTILNNHYKP